MYSFSSLFCFFSLSLVGSRTLSGLFRSVCYGLLLSVERRTHIYLDTSLWQLVTASDYFLLSLRGARKMRPFFRVKGTKSSSISQASLPSILHTTKLEENFSFSVFPFFLGGKEISLIDAASHKAFRSSRKEPPLPSLSSAYLRKLNYKNCLLSLAERDFSSSHAPQITVRESRGNKREGGNAGLFPQMLRISLAGSPSRPLAHWPNLTLVTRTTLLMTA